MSGQLYPPSENQPLLESSNSVSIEKGRIALKVEEPTAPHAGLFSDETKGYLYMLASAFGFTTMALCVRLATSFHGLPVATAVFTRGIVQTTLSLLVVAIFMDFRKTFTMSRGLVFLLTLRGFLGTSALFCVFLSLSMIPLGVQESVFFLNPILTLLLSSAVLRERVGLAEICSALLSFAGVVLVTNPNLELNVRSGSKEHLVGCLVAFLGANLAACAYITVRSFATRLSFILSVFSLGFWVILGGLVMGGASWKAVTEHPKGFAFALIASFFGFIGQCLLNKGFQYCRAGTGVLMRNIDVPLSWLLGLIFLNEVPHVTSLVGSALVLCGTIFVGLKQLIS